MKKGLTEMVFILDRSGSMSGLEDDTIGGFNSTIRKQKREDGEAIVTTVLFDDEYEILHDRFDIGSVGEMTDREYYTRGCTALLDAVGSTVQKTINVQKNLPEKDRAENVVFVIITDGHENSSCEYDYKSVRKMIKKQQDEFGWEFLFLGANIDAAEEGAKIGIRRNRTTRYVHDNIGTAKAYDAIAGAISEQRMSKTISYDWCEEVDADYEEREGGFTSLEDDDIPHVL